MITLIHPSRGRPQMALKAFQEWQAKADGDFQYILSIDYSDPSQQEYTRQSFPEDCIIIGNNRSIVDATNAAAKLASGDILVVMSDDFGCPDHWDTLIQNHYQDMLLLHVYDTIQRDVVTLPILSRKLYERLGYIYHPRYFSMFADNDLTESAKKLGAYKADFSLVFEHRHWVNGKNKRDATYDRENSSQAWKIGEQLFKQRQKTGFGL